MTTHAHVSFVESSGEQTIHFKNHAFLEGVGSQMIAFSMIPRGYFHISHHLWPSALSGSRQFLNKLLSLPQELSS